MGIFTRFGWIRRLRSVVFGVRRFMQAPWAGGRGAADVCRHRHAAGQSPCHGALLPPPARNRALGDGPFARRGDRLDLPPRDDRREVYQRLSDGRLFSSRWDWRSSARSSAAGFRRASRPSFRWWPPSAACSHRHLSSRFSTTVRPRPTAGDTDGDRHRLCRGYPLDGR